MQVLQGSWGPNGFVVGVPIELQPKIQLIRVKGARANVIKRELGLFYVVIPGTIHDADDWIVGVTDKGVLRIGPPQTQVTTQGRGGGGGPTNIITGSVTGMVIQAGNIRGGINLSGGGRVPAPELPTIGLVLPRRIVIQDRL